MNSYERVRAALDHRRPDRPPLNYFGTPETTRALLAHLKLGSHEELLRCLGADMRYVSARYAGPSQFSGFFGFGSGGTDMWGVRWEPARNDYCTYYEAVGQPLAGAETIRDLESYPWPSPEWMSVAHLKEEIRRHNDPERRMIVLPTGPFLEIAWTMRGYEQFLVDLIVQPDLAAYMLERVVGLCREVAMRAIEAADGGIDMAWSASDVGMQTGMIVSPETWRARIKPWHRQLVEPFRKLGILNRYHTDGAVAPIIEELIEMGVDLLDPIQPQAAGMDAESLRDHFGGRISFYGGVDTQHLLPFGTAAEVEAEVLRLIRVLGADGGYMVAASNAVQPDVPIGNILALYRTAREFRY